MFDALGDKLSGVFDGLTGRGALSEKDVAAAMREIRIALLEADVALPVVKTFIERIKAEAVGERVIKSVKPGQMVVKIVHDALIDMLGGTLTDDKDADTRAPLSEQLNLSVKPPAVIVMAGLQGSGKTTTTGKLAKYLKDRLKKKVLLASLDTRRPAAMEQLGMLAEQAGVGFLPIVAGEDAVTIAKRALAAGKLGSYDVVFLDTAGRTTLDDELMDEAAAITAATSPVETLLVADALTGQDAVETAERFHSRLPLTGLVLTRIDGDGRGGAALSMRAVTGLPIKFLGTGEAQDALEAFDAQRLAGRILGQGDIVSLVEKAAQVIDSAEAEKMAKKMKKGTFDLDDLAKQLGQMQKMGGMAGLMKLMPGMGKVKKQIDAAGGIDDKVVKRQQAIIYSMTAKERSNPSIIKASRKKRIAAGSGMSVQDVNKLIKMHRQMADMMKKLGKGGMKSMMGGMPGMGGASMPDLGNMDPKMLADMQRKMGGSNPSGRGLPGLGGGGGLPGLGSPFGKKK
ncbi:MAG: signal recognition particle protein [Robiginitomaculum sp.]